MSLDPMVAIYPLTDADPESLLIAKSTGYPIINSVQLEQMKDLPWLLEVGSQALCLRDRSQPKQKPISCNFLSGPFLQRLKSFGKSQPLAKAIQILGEWPRVLDATAGLGVDGLTLAHLGCEVTMLERSKVIWALLEDGLQRAGQNPQLAESVSRTRAHNLGLSDFFEGSLKKASGDFDVIYLDPMFPIKKKSSLPSKEMQVLRSLLGDDLDFDQTLDTALAHARRKVVVKRPDSAGASARKPDHSVGSKLVRFDVYLK